MIYFKKIQETYVQSGRIELKKTYREGHVHVQGAENIVGDWDNPATLKTLPDYFVNGWAQFMYPVPELASLDADKNFLFDKGAYGVGVPFEVEFLSIPKLKKVTLFYRHDTGVNNETRELVEFDGSAFTPYTGEKADGTTGVVDAAEFVKILSNKVFHTELEYYDWLHEVGTVMEGYNRNGRMLPPGVTKTAVSELMGYKGKVDVEGVLTDVTIHVTPMYIQNDRPMFDLVYFGTDILTDSENGGSASATSLHAGRLLRWYGGSTSTSRHAINWTDDSLQGVSIATGYNLDGTDNPRLDDVLEIDGVQYVNGYDYNVTKKLQ